MQHTLNIHGLYTTIHIPSDPPPQVLRINLKNHTLYTNIHMQHTLNIHGLYTTIHIPSDPPPQVLRINLKNQI